MTIFEDSTWTIKDIIAHISAWHWQLVEDVDSILSNKKPWYGGEDEAGKENEFNRREVEKRKNWSLEKILQEREDSFMAVIERTRRVNDEEWTRESGHNWEDGTPVTVRSLFEYNYEGADHEGGHAKQVLEWRKIQTQSQ